MKNSKSLGHILNDMRKAAHSPCALLDGWDVAIHYWADSMEYITTERTRDYNKLMLEHEVLKQKHDRLEALHSCAVSDAKSLQAELKRVNAAFAAKNKDYLDLLKKRM